MEADSPQAKEMLAAMSTLTEALHALANAGGGSGRSTSSGEKAEGKALPDIGGGGSRNSPRRSRSVEEFALTDDEKREIGEVYDEYVAKMKEELNCDDAYNAEKGLQASEVVRMVMAHGVPREAALQFAIGLDEHSQDRDGLVKRDEFLGYLHVMDYKIKEHDIKELLMRSHPKIGAFGTTWKKKGHISWMLLQCVIIIAFGVCVQLAHVFRFIGVPLSMAYLLTFIFGPVMDVLQNRPLKTSLAKRGALCMPNKDGALSCCHADPILPKKSSICAATRRGIVEFVLLGRVPHMLATLASLVLLCSAFAWILNGLVHEIVLLTNDKTFVEDLQTLLTDMNQWFELSLNVRIIELHEVASIGNVTNGTNATSTDSAVAGAGAQMTHMTLTDALAIVSPYADLFNDFFLTLLLCSYMLFNREPLSAKDVESQVKRSTHPLLMTFVEEVEQQVRFYMVLKTEISIMTGVAIGCALSLCGVRLSFVLGFLAFLLNYIPNVGSLIASVLPIPLVMVDQSLGKSTKLVAIIIPFGIEFFVGNVIEPVMFGQTMNLTSIAILMSLVLGYGTWGLCGAILSVPFLAAARIALQRADHPMAEVLLAFIRIERTDERKACVAAQVDELIPGQKAVSRALSEGMKDLFATLGTRTRSTSPLVAQGGKDGKFHRLATSADTIDRVSSSERVAQVLAQTGRDSADNDSELL